MIKILEDIDVAPLLDCYQRLEKNMAWADYGSRGRQASVQYKSGDDHWTSGVGRSSEEDHEIFGNLNPAFHGTIFAELINKFKLFRTRLMWVGPFACYTMHRDSSPRIHIPLITNPGCYFLFKFGRPQHLAAGKVYFTDTRKFHTFINCSEHHRLHLVGAVSSVPGPR